MKKLPFYKRALLLSYLAIAVVAASCLYLLQHKARDFGAVKVSTILPAKGLTTDAEISPDGAQVAMLYDAGPSRTGPTQGIEVRDARTGRDEGSTVLPTAAWMKGKRQYTSSRPLRYCDAGKYLLVLTFPDMLLVIDAHTLEVHGSIALSGLQVPNAGPEPRRFADAFFLGGVDVDCSAESNVAVVVAHGDLDLLSIKLFDLDKVTELVDLASVLRKEYDRYSGDGFALSPDGLKIAVVVNKFLGKKSGEFAELISTSNKTIIGTLRLGESYYGVRQLAFAGNGALMLGLRECEPGGDCRPRTTPNGQTLRVWQFAGDGKVQTFGWDGAEAYRSLGASSNGERVFAYTGIESFCKSCNNKTGELKIEDARFTVWDRTSGVVAARSPTLKIQMHLCPRLQFIGSCSEWENAPFIEMSEDGKSILVFTFGVYPPVRNSADFGEVNIFNVQ
jgi:hypothetical protein